jgi:hypothetical protein
MTRFLLLPQRKPLKERKVYKDVQKEETVETIVSCPTSFSPQKSNLGPERSLRTLKQTIPTCFG